MAVKTGSFQSSACLVTVTIAGSLVHSPTGSLAGHYKIFTLFSHKEVAHSEAQQKINYIKGSDSNVFVKLSNKIGKSKTTVLCAVSLV